MAEEGPDMSFESMAVLRPELLTMFTRHKVGGWVRERDTHFIDVMIVVGYSTAG